MGIHPLKLITPLLMGWLLLGLFGTGCALSPETAALATVSNPHGGGGEASTFQVLGTRQWPNDIVVVLYRRFRPAPDAEPGVAVVGYQLIEWHSIQWRARGGLGKEQEMLPPEDLIEYWIGRVGDMDKDQLYVVGRVLASEVEAIEIVFEGEQSIRDEADDGVFALLIPDAGVTEGELRILDGEKQILRQDEIRVPKVDFGRTK